MREVGDHVVAAKIQGMRVGIDELFLALELLQEQRLDHRRIDVQQRRKRTHVHDVLEQLPLPRVGVGLVADTGQWHAEHGDVIAQTRR